MGLTASAPNFWGQFQPVSTKPVASGGGSDAPFGIDPSTYGSTDPTVIASQLQKLGVTDPSQIQYWTGKLTSPDTYSDGVNRVGLNPYTIDRITNPASSAGSGVNPGNYGVVGSALPSAGGGGGTLAGLAGANLGGGTTGLVPGQGYVLPSAAQAEQYPGMQFAIDQGTKAIQANKAASGTLRSGGTLKDIAGFATGTALQDYNQLVNQQLAANQYNTGNLFNLANIGLNASTQAGNFGQNFAAGASNSLAGAGNANAAGSIAQGNIFGGAANNVGSNLYQLYLLNQMQNGGGLNLTPGTSGFSAPSDFAM